MTVEERVLTEVYGLLLATRDNLETAYGLISPNNHIELDLSNEECAIRDEIARISAKCEEVRGRLSLSIGAKTKWRDK